MKRMNSLVLIVFLFLAMNSCGYSDGPYGILKNEDFQYSLEYNLETHAFDSYSIGNVFSKKEAVFIPQSIVNIPVKTLGIEAYGGSNHLSLFDGERLYLPNSIEEWYEYYIKQISIDIFYCGKVTEFSDLVFPNYYPTIKIYIPYEEVEDYRKMYEKNGFFIENIYILRVANVSYYLNYPDGIYEYNEFYYIDYYENGELIKYIPPIPEKIGYTFEGWYKEPECINEWNFETDAIIFNDEHPVTKLYAKWILVD